LFLSHAARACARETATKQAAVNLTPVQRLVVVGNGMVGHELVRRVVDGEPARWAITVFGDEPRAAYDRVHLSEYVGGRSADDLSLAPAGWYAAHGVELRTGEPVLAIDRAARTVTSARGATPYDALVLATGSRPFVPPIDGADGPGRFVYRTIEDLDAIAAWAASRGSAAVGAVVGGGLLGLEAAGALQKLGVRAIVLEVAPRLMPQQLDDAGAAALRRTVEAMGVEVRVATTTTAIVPRAGGGLTMRVASGRDVDVDLVVFSAGIRPRDELARAAGLAIGARGGVAIDDACRTSDPAISAIGECAAWGDRVFGLVGPGYAMARVVAAQLDGDGGARFAGADTSTKLKLLGVDVASFGDPFATGREVVLHDGVAARYKKLVLADDGVHLLGGILVGDASDYARLQPIASMGFAVAGDPVALLAGHAGAVTADAELPDHALVCTCNGVTRGAVCDAVRGGAAELGAVKQRTRAGTGCGGCVPQVAELVKRELVARGVAVTDHLCEHVPHSRQELLHLVRVQGLRTFDEILARHGRGAGCEICRPAIASILASTWNEHVLAPAHAPLQDTNDAFLANIQKDGTYSVVPRVPGGEITPAQLITIGQIAQRYDLYTKITGGQRIDMFGARVDELPAIWRELVAAGFESGHAYGKAVRTVKTCVGTTWCRYGVQDSVGLGIRLEHRYKGLRAPHKLKLAVSGCTRECAEAQGKDVGVIATERGYNLYVCGNGGARPRHADLLAVDLDETTLVRYVDRFLIFYIRTADRLQRTARWLEAMDGGLAYLRKVVVEDSLGLGAELEAEMAALVGGYRCEWAATLEDPAKLERFRSFVNTDQPDPELDYVRERGQRRPVHPDERERVHLHVVR
jgi:nitrite reductase (NADH) large subunit